MKMKCLLVAGLLFSLTAAAQVTQEDFDALKVFYEATGGENWKDNSGWDFTNKGPADVKAYDKATGEGWYGITSVGRGRVLKIDLRDNNLVGEIPDAFYSMTYLRQVLLTRNKLSGTISPKIGGMTRLMNISLGYNQLTGTIPAEIVAMGKDTENTAPRPDGKGGSQLLLDLRYNQLSGPIPAAIGTMTLFTKPCSSARIDLSHNQLSGELPAGLGELVSLTGLVLNANQFSGTVPPSIEKLPNLETLILSQNRFTGKVPSIKK